MSYEQNGDTMTHLALVDDLTACLKALDQLGANVAAAHVDAAIHALLRSVEGGKTSIESE